MGVVVSHGVRIEVDPDVLLHVGRHMGSTGAQLGMLSDALGAALGSGIASGWDPAGANFGFKYGRQSQEYADVLAMATDAYHVMGCLLAATGKNYQNADAASTIGGPGPTGSVGGQPGATTAASAPLGPSGAFVPVPTKWAIIQPCLGASMSWPSGNSALLRLTAAEWRNIATGLAAFGGDTAALKDAVSQQDVPEGRRISQALAALANGTTALSNTAKTVAQSIDDFARGVQDTQDAIRRLVDRISFDGLWDTVTGFLTGEGDDILRDVARDVGELLENFQNQVKGIVGLLEELVTALGDVADAFEEWIRPILVESRGDGVGNALADCVTMRTDISVGAVTGVINTVSDAVASADVDTWKGMAEQALSVAKDPSTLPGVLANTGKEFVVWDEWSGEHPGRAAGETAFNIGMLFVPGGALSKTGSVAKGLNYGNRLLAEGRLPRLGDVPVIGNGNRGVPGANRIPGAGRVAPAVSEFRPGLVPDSIVFRPPHGGGDATHPPTASGEAPATEDRGPSRERRAGNDLHPGDTSQGTNGSSTSHSSAPSVPR